MGRRPKKVSITKIAQEAGVSVATVSRAINHRANVSEDTRKKINELLKKYNFLPTPAVPREKKIALLTGSSRLTEYTSEVFNGIYQYTEENALATTIIFSKENSRYSLIEQVREQQCSGVVVILPATFSEELDSLAESDLPVVLIDEAVYRKGLGFIDHDSYSGSKNAVEHLLKLGHQKIAYLKCNTQTLNHIQRFKAYENTLAEAGVKTQPAWVQEIEPESHPYLSGYNAALKLLKNAPEITAIMTTNDDIAIGAMKAIQEKGIRIPEDISIIGFDNYCQSDYVSPELTTVNHPIEEAGFLAAKSIDEFLKNPQGAKLPQEILPTKLIVRNSTA